MVKDNHWPTPDPATACVNSVIFISFIHTPFSWILKLGYLFLAFQAIHQWRQHGTFRTRVWLPYLFLGHKILMYFDQQNHTEWTLSLFVLMEGAHSVSRACFFFHGANTCWTFLLQIICKFHWREPVVRLNISITPLLRRCETNHRLRYVP